MRSYVRLFAIILLFILPVCVSAVDLESLGFSIVSQQQEDDRTVYNVNDANGNQFSIQYSGDLTENMGSIIRRSVTEFFSWTLMDIGYLRISFTEDGATVLIIPETYTFDGVDLTPYLPSGIQFYVSRIFEYDFRINVEKVFIRLRGQLSNENRFTERLASAIEDPAGFIERNDPDYVLRELRDIDATLIELDIADEDLEILMNGLIDTLREDNRRIDDAIRGDLAQAFSELGQLNQDVSDMYDETTITLSLLRNDFTDAKRYGSTIIRDYNRTKQQLEDLERQFQFLKDRFQSHQSEFSSLLARVYALEQAHANLEAEHTALKESHETLSENHEALKEELSEFKTAYESDLSGQESADKSLQDQISWLRYAFIGVANKSFFGQLRHVEEDAAARIVEHKQQTPELTVKEIASTLSAEEIKVSEKGIRYVLLTYLGIRDEN